MIGLGSACHPVEPTRVIAQATERIRAEPERVVRNGGQGDMRGRYRYSGSVP